MPSTWIERQPSPGHPQDSLQMPGIVPFFDGIKPKSRAGQTTTIVVGGIVLRFKQSNFFPEMIILPVSYFHA
jgi:hypothetical protein